MPTDPTSLGAILDIAWRGGLLLALLYFIWAGATRRIVWAYQLDELKAQIEFLRADYEKRLDRCETESARWRDAAIESREITRSTVNVLEKSK